MKLIAGIVHAHTHTLSLMLPVLHSCTRFQPILNLCMSYDQIKLNLKLLLKT